MAPNLEKLQGLRILVAEDELLVLLVLENMLREIGCEVVGPVATVDAALDAISRGGIDGALLEENCERSIGACFNQRALFRPGFDHDRVTHISNLDCFHEQYLPRLHFGANHVGDRPQRVEARMLSRRDFEGM